MLYQRARTFGLNEDFFSCIDSEKKAYVLGFIYADGNINDFVNKDAHYRLRITLKAADEEILIKIKDALEFEGSIKVRDLKGKKAREGYRICELAISSKKLITDLYSLGVVPNKTFIKTFPKLPEHLIRHFLRGYFDGNGSIYLKNANNDSPTCTVSEISTGSRSFIEGIGENLNAPLGIYLKYGDRVTNFRYNYAKANTVKVLNHLYNDCEIFMKRKYDLALPVLCPLGTNLQEVPRLQ